MSRRRRFLTAALPASMAVVALGLPFLGTETEWAVEKCWSGAPEGTEGSLEGWSWWPLGTRCSLSRGGELLRTVVVAPWRGEAWAP